jgi:3-oxoacyl-ACP reductase-like protein
MPLGRRRPLLRAAAVGGGAYVAGRRHAERRQAEETQDERLNSLESESYAPPAAAAPPPAPPAAAPPAPAPPASGGIQPDALDRLKELGALHEQGVLTDQEFAEQKARLLG